MSNVYIRTRDLRENGNKLLEISLPDASTEALLNSSVFSDDAPFDMGYMNYKNTYGLKFDPSRLELRLQNPSYGVRDYTTTIDPKLDFSVQKVSKTTKKSKLQLGVRKNATKAPAKRRKKVQYFGIRNPLTVVATSNKPLNDTTRVKKLEKYHKVLGSLKKTVKKLKRLTRDNSTKVVSDKISARWLDVLDIVEYETQPLCASSPRPLAGLVGQCYSEKKCAMQGGMAFDYCSHGYGVCCIFKMSCNGFTEQEVSYFDSPGYPAPSLGELSCSMAILLRPNTQQLLLEFEFFELLPPDSGDCLADKFVVTGPTHKPVPIICGINTGQHMFVDIDSSAQGKVFLTVVGNGNEPRGFRIKVTQLFEKRAPADCLQYYETIAGRLTSFNYENAAKIVRRRSPSYFNNLNYAICIKRLPGYCTVTYSAEEPGGTPRTFQLINTDNDGMRTLPMGQAGVELVNCPDDFLAVNSIRLCGDRFNDATIVADFTANAPVTDFSYGPIVLPFRTDQSLVGRGFSLFFVQRPCSGY